jgi:hypothetical protein
VESWYDAFRVSLRTSLLADQLRSAADGARLGPWTELLTGLVVEVSSAKGWACAAKRTAVGPLPVGRGEYLAIDVLAFEPGAAWRPPVAAFELENSQRDNYVAYALWKACTVRADLAVLFCYRPTGEGVGALTSLLQRDVLAQIPLPPAVLVVVGTRADAITFPDGYFRPFRWQADKRSLVSFSSARTSSQGR